MTSVIASIIDKYLMMLPGDRNMMEREFTRLETTVRDVGTAVGQSGHITRVTAGNVIFGETDGIKLLNPSIGRYSIDLQSDGDAFFGSDTSAPDHTALAIFSNSQRYNGELFGAGDLLVGDNSSGKANLQWDASTGRLNFRGGATTNAYISAAGYLNATGATISGTITAAAGSIGGWTINADNIAKTGIILDSGDDAIYVGASAPRLVIDGANKVIKSSSYASGVSGFSINGATGDAEFNNIVARGEIRTAVLAYGEIQATAGTLGVFKSAGKLREDRMTQANFNIDIEDPATGHMQLFAVNDILRIKDTSGDFWLRVNSAINLGTYYRYAVTLMNGSAGATIKAGAAVVDYGPSGTGFITLSADGTVGSSANITIARHAGSPWSAQTNLVRLGNLNGSYGMTLDRWGIGLGDYDTGNFLRYYAGSGMLISSGSGRMSLANNGLWITDAGSAAVLGVSCADGESWGGLTLNTGDIMFGYTSASAGGWLLFDRDGSGGKGILTIGYGTTDIINFTSTGASLDGLLWAGGANLSSSGLRLVTGTGTGNRLRWEVAGAGGSKSLDIFATESGVDYYGYVSMQDPGTTPTSRNLIMGVEPESGGAYLSVRKVGLAGASSITARLENATDEFKIVGDSTTNFTIRGTGQLITSSYFTVNELTDNPSFPVAGAACNVYMKGDKFVIQYRDGTTTRYKYLDLTGTGVTWTHSTTAP
jgi:hypothetical protein